VHRPNRRPLAAGGEFVPYFQPVVDLRSGQLAGFELLARQHAAAGGIIGPEAFIPAAEKEGWINDLTLHLLKSALGTFTQLPGEPFLAFNISAVQLHDLELPERVKELTESAAFPPERLSVEVTETSLLPDLEAARKVAERFRSMGCGLGLDDFGTGYSSLKTLQLLPFNVLKVDRSFVSTMTTARESRKIVAAVVGLGQSLGITTVAEGIETQEENEMVDWLGCEFGQGWFHGRPVPAEGLAKACSQPRSKCAPQRAVEEMECRRSLSRFDSLPYVRLAQLRSVYDAVPVGLAFVDCQERYVSINRRLADINGADMIDHLGRTVSEMVPKVYPQVGPDLRQALRGESVLASLVVGQPHPSSETRKFLVSYEPARDEGGEVVGVSIAVLEINSIDAHLPAALRAMVK
jgi:EAL domain-containing protein (putative c-di-GMP-specific phosphodiesterase class I)